jgi:peptide-methionine (S)-S-oxide reductase
MVPLRSPDFAMTSASKTPEPPTLDTAPSGRAATIPTARTHFVNGHALKGSYPDGMEIAVLAMGCFWGVERVFWTSGESFCH